MHFPIPRIDDSSRANCAVHSESPESRAGVLAAGRRLGGSIPLAEEKDSRAPRIARHARPASQNQVRGCGSTFLSVAFGSPDFLRKVAAAPPESRDPPPERCRSSANHPEKSCSSLGCRRSRWLISTKTLIPPAGMSVAWPSRSEGPQRHRQEGATGSFVSTSRSRYFGGCTNSRCNIMVRTAVLSLCVAASLDLTSSFSPASMPSLTLATSSFLCAPPLQARTTRVRSAATNWLAKIEYGEMQHAGVLVKDTAKSIEFYTKALPPYPLWPFRPRCSVAWRGVAADGLNPAETARELIF